MAALDQLAPGFLIAAPTLQDPNFEHAVVLMCMHNAEGALGLVVNRPAPLSLDDIMVQLDVKRAVPLQDKIMVGGPVSIDTGMLLFSCPEELAHGEEEILITDELRLTPSRQMLEAIAAGEGPGRHLMFLGHSGWGAGQLEQEIAQGAWIPADLNLDLIFATPFEERWEQALQDEGMNPAQVGFFRPRV